MKRWRKQKAGRQESKRRKTGTGPTGPAAESGGGGGGGTMSGMRRGIASILGGRTSNKPKGTAEKLLDGVMWVAVVVAGIYFLQNRCMG